jgi:hypothetical protein
VIPRVYIDTSVIGGCFDTEFRRYSERLLEDFAEGRFVAVISDVTIEELQRSPVRVKALLEHPALQHAQRVNLDEEAIALAEKYIEQGVVSPGRRLDARHVAIATVQRVDIVVSWNFQHIVKWSRIRAFNAVNLLGGYPEIEIRSPAEVCHEEDKDL